LIKSIFNQKYFQDLEKEIFFLYFSPQHQYESICNEKSNHKDSDIHKTSLCTQQNTHMDEKCIVNSVHLSIVQERRSVVRQG